MKPLTRLFGLSRKESGSVISETDLRVHRKKFEIRKFSKIFFRKIIFKILTALLCPLEALDRFNNAAFGSILVF